MSHLISEHSSECLLSLVEMMNFKECVLNVIKSLDSQSGAATATPSTGNVSVPTPTTTAALSLNGHDVMALSRGPLTAASKSRVNSRSEEAADSDPVELDEEEPDPEVMATAHCPEDEDPDILEIPSFADGAETELVSLDLVMDGVGDGVGDVEVAVADGASAGSKGSRPSLIALQRVLSPSMKKAMSIRLPAALRGEGRGRSGSLSTVNGLIVFPKSLPKSAICHRAELLFLTDIPGVEMSPRQRLGAAVEDEVVAKCAAIRHRRSSSSERVETVWTASKGTAPSMATTKGPAERDRVRADNESQSASSVMAECVDVAAAAAAEATVSAVEEWKVRGYMMWYKYAAEGAEFEINIDYGTRHSLSCSMRDINEWLSNEAVTLQQLSVLFDVCMHQMYQFCKASMLRFKRSDDFEALLRCFAIEPHQEEYPELQVAAISP